MAANTRTEFQIARDRHEIATLYARATRSGLPLTHWQIAEVLNRRRFDEWMTACKDDPDSPAPYELTRQMITYDLKAIVAGWVRTTTFDLDEIKAAQLAKIDFVEACATDAWERSLKDADETEMEKVAVKDPQTKRRIPGLFELNKQKSRRKQMLGNDRFLRIMLDCVAQRCEIFNIPNDGQKRGASVADLVKLAAEAPPESDLPQAQEKPAHG